MAIAIAPAHRIPVGQRVELPANIGGGLGTVVAHRRGVDAPTAANRLGPYYSVMPDDGGLNLCLGERELTLAPAPWTEAWQ